MNESRNEYINTSDFKGFKIMHNGPHALRGSFPNGTVSFRTRTGACDIWKGDKNGFVSLDLREHDYQIDAYAFLIYEMSKKQCVIIGWILFDELQEKAKVFLEDETVILAIPIKNLRQPEELTELLGPAKGNKKLDRK